MDFHAYPAQKRSSVPGYEKRSLVKHPVWKGGGKITLKGRGLNAIQQNRRVLAYQEGRAAMEHIRSFLSEEEGVGVVEIILILVVLISLVLIFKTQLTNLVKSIFSKIVSQSNSV